MKDLGALLFWPWVDAFGEGEQKEKRRKEKTGTTNLAFEKKTQANDGGRVRGWGRVGQGWGTTWLSSFFHLGTTFLFVCFFNKRNKKKKKESAKEISGKTKNQKYKSYRNVNREVQRRNFGVAPQKKRKKKNKNKTRLRLMKKKRSWLCCWQLSLWCFVVQVVKEGGKGFGGRGWKNRVVREGCGRKKKEKERDRGLGLSIGLS